MSDFDVIVIGAGHAGIEAAFACANLKLKTAIFTIDKNAVAIAPCNPSIGGPAKGIVTREIDALGGMQAIATDANCLQIKLLNSSKGPGVWAYRAQIDKDQYHNWFLNKIQKHKYLTLMCDEVTELIVKQKQVIGIKTKNHDYYAKTVIITTGTYLKSLTFIGNEINESGPVGFKNANYLSDNLKKLGFELIRLKTGTPPRIKWNSFDSSKMEIQPGTNKNLHFSIYTKKPLNIKNQIPCYLTHTNEKTHEIIKKNLTKSAMYSGKISGIGPRYCPSIEDKIVRFSSKPRHQIFIEPLTRKCELGYLQGLSTSLPKDVQEQLVHSIRGLEYAKIVQYAYAIEYDAINPIQLYPTLESKLIKNLFFAGQINGTSGYEEAAGQGIIAGINAALSIKNKKKIILNRTNSYIGVMIDDIVTKGIKDPYRLLTSRAEHRLYLRNDNADDRLIKIGYKIGLVSKTKYQKYLDQNKTIKEIINYLKNTSLKVLDQKYHIYKNHHLYDLLKRPEISLKEILINSKYAKISDDLASKIEILIKFDGYIAHEEKNLNKFNKNLNLDISFIKDYNLIINLSLEAREKLNKIKPMTLAQAAMIPGINTNDLMIIKIYSNGFHHE